MRAIVLLRSFVHTWTIHFVIVRKKPFVMCPMFLFVFLVGRAAMYISINLFHSTGRRWVWKCLTQLRVWFWRRQIFVSRWCSTPLWLGSISGKKKKPKVRDCSHPFGWHMAWGFHGIAFHLWMGNMGIRLPYSCCLPSATWVWQTPRWSSYASWSLSMLSHDWQWWPRPFTVLGRSLAGTFHSEVSVTKV